MVWLLQGLFCALALSIFPLPNTVGIAAIVFYVVICSTIVFLFRKRRRIVVHLYKNKPGRKKKTRSTRSITR